MITYTIKTYSCSCGYKQDFEPTKELMELHFNSSKRFKVKDIKAGECPSCALKGVRNNVLNKEADSQKKIMVRHLEQSDIDTIRTSLEAEPIQKVKTGSKLFRLVDITKPDVLEQFNEERDETPQERAARIANHVSKLKLAPSQEIQTFRALFEKK